MKKHLFLATLAVTTLVFSSCSSDDDSDDALQQSYENVCNKIVGTWLVTDHYEDISTHTSPEITYGWVDVSSMQMTVEYRSDNYRKLITSPRSAAFPTISPYYLELRNTPWPGAENAGKDGKYPYRKGGVYVVLDGNRQQAKMVDIKSDGMMYLYSNEDGSPLLRYKRIK